MAVADNNLEARILVSCAPSPAVVEHGWVSAELTTYNTYMSTDLHVHMTPFGSKTYTEVVFLGHTERAKLAMPDGCARVYMSMKSGHGGHCRF